MTKLLKLEPGADRKAIVEEAAKTLKEGGLVVFPTETVYGLAANQTSPDAMANLSELKRRPAEKHYTLMLANVEDVYRRLKKVPLLSRKVMNRFWPGPLTIVFGDEGDEGLGIRIPAAEIAREIIEKASAPIVVTSANAGGRPPATNAAQAHEYLDGKVDMIIDGGEARLKEPSTVVMFRGGTWQILREGLVSEDMIARHAHTTILFVCTGNSCRSPLGEVLCRKLLADKLECTVGELDDFGYTVASAGTDANAGFAASEEARTIAREMGTRLDEHTTRPLTRRIVLDADVILTFTYAQLEHIKRMEPEAHDKVILLADAEISDPSGSALDQFRESARKIEDALKQRLEEFV